MARAKAEAGLKPSILDRLIDPESAGTAWRPGYGLHQVREVLRRDMEDLLNTRRTALGPTGLHASILAFGLPELTAFEVITPDQQRELGEILAKTIQQFEPRLRDVHVSLVVPEGESERGVSFRIDARLSVEPYDDVAFQTVLELSTGRYSVEAVTS